jgi:hypothetical protein
MAGRAQWLGRARRLSPRTRNLHLSHGAMTTRQYDVLAFGAHPDDMEAVMGGTAAKLAAKGRSILFGSGRLAATDGYFSTGYGTQSKGVAGAGVAIATDTLAPALNPATLVFVTDQIDLGASLFNPNRSYSVTGQPSGSPGTFGLAPGTVDSGSRLFAIPAFGMARKAGSNGAFGVALYGNGGMNTNYNAPTFGVTPAGVDLSQMFICVRRAPHHRRHVHDRGTDACGFHDRRGFGARERLPAARPHPRGFDVNRDRRRNGGLRSCARQRARAHRPAGFHRAAHVRAGLLEVVINTTTSEGTWSSDVGFTTAGLCSS